MYVGFLSLVSSFLFGLAHIGPRSAVFLDPSFLVGLGHVGPRSADFLGKGPWSFLVSKVQVWLFSIYRLPPLAFFWPTLEVMNSLENIPWTFLTLLDGETIKGCKSSRAIQPCYWLALLSRGLARVAFWALPASIKRSFNEPESEERSEGREKWSWSLSLRLVYPVLHKPPGATIISRSAVRIRINFWRMVGLYISFGDWANALECWRSPSLRLVIPGIAVSPGVTHSDGRIVFVTGTVVKPQQPPQKVNRIANLSTRAVDQRQYRVLRRRLSTVLV